MKFSNIAAFLLFVLLGCASTSELNLARTGSLPSESSIIRAPDNSERESPILTLYPLSTSLLKIDFIDPNTNQFKSVDLFVPGSWSGNRPARVSPGKYSLLLLCATGGSQITVGLNVRKEVIVKPNKLYLVECLGKLNNLNVKVREIDPKPL